MQDKILIVDDDDLVLACFQRVLSRNFNVETAAGPHAALDAVRAGGQYAVVMSDLRMPGMNGIQLLEKVRELSPTTVGIVLSGNVEPGQFKSEVVYRVLDKPCPPQVLTDALSEAISYHHELTGNHRDG